MNNAQAGTVGDFYRTGGAFSGDAFTNYINAMTNAAELRGKAQNAKGDAAMSLLGMFLKGGAG